MADEEDEEDNMKDLEIQDLKDEIAGWNKKYKTLETKKRESDVALNKIKTEINSLRSVDKNWKESAKAVHHALTNIKQQFDIQADQIVDGMSGISKAGARVTEKVPYMIVIKKKIAEYQAKIKLMDSTIMDLTNKIARQDKTIEEKSAKIRKLSAGIDEEVARLCKPIRQKLAETMMLVMKEKAERAQERREIADLWPDKHLLPSLLMRYRALTDEERNRRIEVSREINASFALSVEIRANVAESKSWDLQYDDYGRPFYQHKVTGETSEEEPPILKYKPPPGREENGNVEDTEENDITNWKISTDSRGTVFYQHKETGEITYVPPNAYTRIPPGRSKETIVSEAAAIVLNYIKNKILKHISKMKRLKEELENPMTPDEKVKKEKEDRNKDPNDPTLQASTSTYSYSSVKYLVLCTFYLVPASACHLCP